MTTTPKYLDLDALAAEEEFFVKLKGKDHKLEPMSVDAFINTTKLIQESKAEAGIEEEIQTLVKLLKMAFPTMSDADLRGLPLTHLNALLEFAMQKNGAKEVTQEAEKEAAANPPKAGS